MIIFSTHSSTGKVVISTAEKKVVVGSSAATVTPTKTTAKTPTLTPTATPTPEPTPTVATLVVSSNPSGANIFIDKNYKGFIPTTQTDIAPRTHVVLLKKEGYLDYEHTIKFEAGTTYDKAKASEVFIDLIKQYPTMALIGVIIIGFGVLALLIRRKR